MLEYNLGFSKKVTETARLVVDHGVDSFDAVQTIGENQAQTCILTSGEN